MCGILKRDNLENPDIGFAFLPEYTGKGFAFEIANATMTYARGTLKLPTVYAITIPTNKASIKLLQKIGLRFVRKFYFPNDSEELMLFGTPKSP
jgi:RimJ/RimL family protein N-acetyltransferase